MKVDKEWGFWYLLVYNIISYEVPCTLFFLGKVFGRLRLLGVFLFLCGLQFGIRFLQATICKVEGLILLTSALCVVVMGRRWIICYFAMERLISYGVWFSDLLGFHGFAKVGCRYSFWLVELVWKALV